MCILNLTLGTERRADSAEVEISLSEDNLVELTRTIAAAHTARGRAHLARSEIDLALADLDIALGHDPHNREAIITRAQAHLQKGNHYHAYKDVEPILGLDVWDVEALHIRGRIYQATGRIEQAERDFAAAKVRTGLPRTGFERTHLSAGYHVVARFEPYSPAPDFLIVTYPLDALSEALADADRFSYAPEDRRRLVENGVIDDPDFDAVVYEVRSVAREIQSYGALDDAGHPLVAGGTRADGCDRRLMLQQAVRRVGLTENSQDSASEMSSPDRSVTQPVFRLTSIVDHTRADC